MHISGIVDLHDIEQTSGGTLLIDTGRSDGEAGDLQTIADGLS